MCSIEFTVLGSGGFAPQGAGAQVRNPSGYAVQYRSSTILLDLGFGNVRQLARAGIALESASHVLLSHFHPDHWGDLPALLFHFRYAAKPQGGKLTVAGPVGTRKLLEGIHTAFGGYTVPQGYELEAAEFGPDAPLAAPGFTLYSTPTGHTPEALALRLELGGKTICYTGDASDAGGLADFFRPADLLVADAALPQTAPEPRKHMTPAQAAALAADCGAKQTLFSHLTQESAVEAAALARGNGTLAEAVDLLRITV